MPRPRPRFPRGLAAWTATIGFVVLAVGSLVNAPWSADASIALQKVGIALLLLAFAEGGLALAWWGASDLWWLWWADLRQRSDIDRAAIAVGACARLVTGILIVAGSAAVALEIARSPLPFDWPPEVLTPI